MDQYTLTIWNRIELGFSIGRWIYWWETNGPGQHTIDGVSVTKHVAALENAVRRCASNDNPFNSEWEKAISTYAGNSRARFWTAFYAGFAVGILRMSLLDIVINEAILGLYLLSIQLNGQFTSDDGWVFYLLETRLGETFKQIHKDLPKEGLNSNEEGYKPIGDVPELLKGFREKLRQARDQAIEFIKRIHASRKPTQRFQIFDIFDGSQVNDEGWERHWDSQGDDREGSHEVILRAQSEPAGLGVGYISWTATNGTSHLVGFSTLPQDIGLEGRVKAG